jgi:transposase-like protein
MERRPNEDRQRYWRDVLARQRRSGLPVATFCRQHEVSPAAFYGWRRRLVGETSGKSTEVSFVPLPLDQAVSPRAAEFSLQLPNGVHATVPHDFDEAALGRLLRVAGMVESRDA